MRCNLLSAVQGSICCRVRQLRSWCDSFDGESQTHVYDIAKLIYEFLGDQSVDVAGVNVAFEPQKLGGELGLGGKYEWAGSK